MCLWKKRRGLGIGRVALGGTHRIPTVGSHISPESSHLTHLQKLSNYTLLTYSTPGTPTLICFLRNPSLHWIQQTRLLCTTQLSALGSQGQRESLCSEEAGSPPLECAAGTTKEGFVRVPGLATRDSDSASLPAEFPLGSGEHTWRNPDELEGSGASSVL